MPASRSAWTVKARGETTCLSSARGGRSNTKRSTCAPTTASRPPAKACPDIRHSTARGGHTHRWTGKRPIRHISTRRNRSRPRHDRAENPPAKQLETAQTNRTTSIWQRPHLLARNSRLRKVSALAAQLLCSLNRAGSSLIFGAGIGSECCGHLSNFGQPGFCDHRIR